MRFKLWGIYGIMLAMLAASVVKIATVMVDHQVAAVGSTQGIKTVTVGTVRGTFYDRNMQLLVNEQKRCHIALLPQMDKLNLIKPYLNDEHYRLLLDKATTGIPLTAQLDTPMPSHNGIHSFNIAQRYGDQVFAPHLLGYTDQGLGTGVYGLERLFDNVLSQYTGSIKMSFPTNGIGVPLEQKEPTIVNTIANSVGGVKLTIDKDIQTIIDDIAEQYIQKGAIIMMDAQNGEILAMGSYPSFHPDHIDESLDDSGEPLINRALSLFDCGSVFKIVTTMAALEYGIPPERCFDCSGSITIGETVFHCHNRNGHGLQNMKTAFANSCNTYYIQLAKEIGSVAMQDMMQKLGLYETTTLTNGWETSAAVIPKNEDLTADAALANLSFGQGELLLTPLQTTLLSGVIASGGNLLSPEVVLGLVDANKSLQKAESRGGKTIISARTVRIMREMMRCVVTVGTGIRAQGDCIEIAGKTGTAETGQFNSSGRPVVQSWFTGFLPADHPKYVVTFLAEDAQNLGTDASLAVCEFSNKLYKLKGNGG